MENGTPGYVIDMVGLYGLTATDENLIHVDEEKNDPNNTH